MDISRIVSGKLRLERSRFDPRATIEAAVETLRPALEPIDGEAELTVSDTDQAIAPAVVTFGFDSFSDSTAIKQPSGPQPLPTLTLSERRVLVVDDEPHTRSRRRDRARPCPEPPLARSAACHRGGLST